MAEIICMASSKGGSGKTTITAALGTFLARSGRKVLLIDCDEGTYGLTLMYLEEVNRHRKRSDSMLVGTFDVTAKVRLDALGESSLLLEDNLYLLPARHVFRDTELVSVGNDFQSSLNLILNYHRDDFDFIFLDAQAGISTASKAAMSPKSSDIVVLVSEYDPMSNAGIERLKARLQEELDVSRTWILLNKLLPEFVSKFSEFLLVARYLPPIPWTADVVRAYSRRQLALDFENGNQFTLAILSVLRELLDRSERKQLDEWVNSQTQRLREPIEEQIEDTERMLAQMRKLAEEEVNADRNISTFVLSQFSSVFSLLAAVLATFVGFADITNNSAVLDFLASNSSFLAGVGAAGFIALLSFVVQAWQRQLSERRKVLQQKVEIQYDALEEMSRRLEELKSLRNAGFEDLVKKQAE
ncbi:ParA family protein [Agrobacterium rosae]|uniref:Cell division inhibitor MinD n=1 Tax=Agrobacterium rosae TaxID=1972867 RepID=A0A1R3TIP4_9HYPH|nr:ParA family protein [Agrobacterium rosae]SCX03973.1 Cell division inhibitor MinD [Agrobacterium rosae]